MSYVTALCAFMLAATTVTAEAKRAELPNIVLCMADDQGWGDVGYYGHSPVKTPVMDEMASTALRLDRFYAAAPVCSPTRGSVMTGRHPNRFGCFSWGHTLRIKEITVAEALKTAGYTTGHFGKWHLGPVRADSPVCPGNSGFDEWFSSPNFYENSPLMSHNGTVVKTDGESSHVTMDVALDFIREATAQGKPFLAVVWFGNPHSPHVGWGKFLEMYDGLPKNQQNFYAEITAMDAALGKLRKELRSLQIADNTMLWYTSDNGALKVGSTGGLSGGKGNLREGGIRVPAIIEWPAVIKAPRISEWPSGTVDIYPTLLEMAGVKMPQQPYLDGVSLLPLIEGKTERERERPLGFWVHPTRGIGTPSAKWMQVMLDEQQGNQPATRSPDDGKVDRQYPVDPLPGPSAWIDGRFKLHRVADKSGDRVQFELFDLEQDPQEESNLADAQPDRVKRMQAELEAWQHSVVRSLNGEDY